MRHEAYLPLSRFVEPIRKSYPKGRWRPCMVHGQPGWVWDMPGKKALWVIRLEVEGETMLLRQLSVKRGEIGYIVPKYEAGVAD